MPDPRWCFYLSWILKLDWWKVRYGKIIEWKQLNPRFSIKVAATVLSPIIFRWHDETKDSCTDHDQRYLWRRPYQHRTGNKIPSPRLNQSKQRISLCLCLVALISACPPWGKADHLGNIILICVLASSNISVYFLDKADYLSHAICPGLSIGVRSRSFRFSPWLNQSKRRISLCLCLVALISACPPWGKADHLGDIILICVLASSNISVSPLGQGRLFKLREISRISIWGAAMKFWFFQVTSAGTLVICLSFTNCFNFWGSVETPMNPYISFTITIHRFSFLTILISSQYITITHLLDCPIPKWKRLSSPVVIEDSPDHTDSPPDPIPAEVIHMTLLVPNLSRKKHIISNTTTENKRDKDIPWEGKNAGVSIRCNKLTY